MTREKRLHGDASIGWCLALACLGFVVRVGACWWLRPTTPVGDMEAYLGQAYRLASGARFEGTYVTPGYPLVLAAAMRLLGTGIGSVGVLHGLLGGIAVECTFLAARRLVTPTLAFVSAAIVALDPAEVFYATMVLSESLALALVAAALAALESRSARLGAVLGGLLLGCAALARESIVLLLPLLSLQLWREKGWRLAVACLVAGFLPIAPWTIRNRVVTGQWILISSRAGYNLLVGNNPYADGSQRGGKRIFQITKPPVPETLPPAVRHQQGTHYALTWMTSHPKEFAAKGLAGTLRMFGLERQFLYCLREGYYGHRPGRIEKALLAGASVGSWIIVLPLSILGLLVGATRLRGLGLCALLWLGILALVAFGEWRFRMPVIPVFILLAAAGGEALLRRRVHLRTYVIAGAMFLPVLAYWVGEIIERGQDIGQIAA